MGLLLLLLLVVVVVVVVIVVVVVVVVVVVFGNIVVNIRSGSANSKRDFSPFLNVHAGSEAHLAPCSLDTGVKRPGREDDPWPPFRMLRISGSKPRLPALIF